MTRWADDDEEDEDDDDEPLSIDEDAPEHDDASEDDDAPDDGDAEDFGTVPCPYCGRSISDFAEVCPHCKSFISREDVPADRKPTWVVVVTVLLLIALTVGVISFR